MFDTFVYKKKLTQIIFKKIQMESDAFFPEIVE